MSNFAKPNSYALIRQIISNEKSIRPDSSVYRRTPLVRLQVNRKYLYNRRMGGRPGSRHGGRCHTFGGKQE